VAPATRDSDGYGHSHVRQLESRHAATPQAAGAQHFQGLLAYNSLAPE
jgi:hypothetical protein